MSTLLEVSGVSVSFDGFKAINNLSFHIGDAEMRAIIGPNGAGKTTLMDIVTGKTKPDEGRVVWGEKNISLLGLSESRIAQEGVGRKFQRPTVFEAQTVRENLSMALKNKRSPFDVLLYRRNAEARARLEVLAEEVGLMDQLERMAGELSHGQKQWLEIGMLLAQEPRLLLVDEPAAGMTPEEREHTTDILVEAAKTRAVVVVEHDMEFVRRLNCKVTVLHEGAVLAEGSIDHVTSNLDVIDVYLGRSDMLNVENLSLHYGQSQILRDVSLEAETGQITCLMGTNGVGKTSLLKAISGAHAPSGGKVFLDGQDLTRQSAHAVAKAGIGYVPQGREIFPLLTVRENLETGYNCIDRADWAVPDEIFELFPVLNEMQNRRGGDLSGGQQQQLAIGRALITHVAARARLRVSWPVSKLSAQDCRQMRQDR